MKRSSAFVSILKVSLVVLCILSFFPTIATEPAEAALNCYTPIPVSAMKPEQKAAFLAQWGPDCFQHCMEKPCLQGADAQGLQDIGQQLGQQLMQQALDAIKQALSGGGGGGSGGGSGSGGYENTDLGYSQEDAINDLYDSFGGSETDSNVFDFFGTEGTSETGGQNTNTGSTNSGTGGAATNNPDSTTETPRPGAAATAYFCENGVCPSASSFTTTNTNTNSSTRDDDNNQSSSASQSQSNTNSGSNVTFTDTPIQYDDSNAFVDTAPISTTNSTERLSWAGQTPTPSQSNDPDNIEFIDDSGPDRIIYGSVDPLTGGSLALSRQQNVSNTNPSSNQSETVPAAELAFLNSGGSPDQTFAWELIDGSGNGASSPLARFLQASFLPNELSWGMISPLHGITRGVSVLVQSVAGSEN